MNMKSFPNIELTRKLILQKKKIIMKIRWPPFLDDKPSNFVVLCLMRWCNIYDLELLRAARKPSESVGAASEEANCDLTLLGTIIFCLCGSSKV
jgi:hypothetical protein